MKIQCPKCESTERTTGEVRSCLDSTHACIDVFFDCGGCGVEYEVGFDPTSIQLVHEEE